LVSLANIHLGCSYIYTLVLPILIKYFHIVLAFKHPFVNCECTH